MSIGIELFVAFCASPMHRYSSLLKIDFNELFKDAFLKVHLNDIFFKKNPKLYAN